MVEKCENCKHFKKLKHNFTRMYGFELSHCCDVLYSFGDDGWVQEVSPNDMCEMFSSLSEPDKTE